MFFVFYPKQVIGTNVKECCDFWNVSYCRNNFTIFPPCNSRTTYTNYNT